MKSILIPTIAFCALLPLCSSASLIVSYDTSSASGNEATLPGSAPNPGISASVLARGTGLGTTTGSGSFNSNSWSSEAASPASDIEYISFGFSVDSATTVDLTDLTIQTRSSNTGPGTLGLYTSLDTFTNPIATFSQSGDASLDSTIDLSSLPLLSNQSIEFRVIEIGDTQADGSGATSGGGTFRVANFGGPISINGAILTAVVPEPSSIIIFAGFGVLLSLFRRKRSIRERTADLQNEF